MYHSYANLIQLHSSFIKMHIAILPFPFGVLLKYSLYNIKTTHFKHKIAFSKVHFYSHSQKPNLEMPVPGIYYCMVFSTYLSFYMREPHSIDGLSLLPYFSNAVCEVQCYFYINTSLSNLDYECTILCYSLTR